MRRIGLGAAAGALTGYSLWEPYRFRLAERFVPVEAGRLAVSILHLSDTHLRASDGRLLEFLEGLPEAMGEVPDLVVATGDMIEGDSGIVPLVEALTRLEARLGRFYVLGSHDYYSSKGASYGKYFSREHKPVRAPRNSTGELERGLQDKGWVPLTNSAETIETPDGKVLVAGVDDPHLRRHRTEHIHTDGSESLAIGLVHAPDVVSEWALNGFDLILAGHTHGGQVRIPGMGAVVTNCSLPTGLAVGLNRVGRTWLHVSPGLGNGRYTPIRFGCRPEATFLRLVPSTRASIST